MITQNLNKQQLSNFFSPIFPLVQSFQAQILYTLSNIHLFKRINSSKKI